MSESNRLSESTEWIDLEFVERERTPRAIIEKGIRHCLARLSLSNTVILLEELGVDRSRAAVHNWVQKADLQPADGGNPDRVAVDQKAIRINDEQYWLYAAVDPETNRVLHSRLFPTIQFQLYENFSLN
jgi:putative transposase